MPRRIKPYENTSVNWQTIFTYPNIRIPMQQRRFEWEDEDISKFLKDLFYIYGKNWNERMGTIISYKDENDIYEVYDGQQRLLITFIILCMLNNQVDKLKTSITPWIFIDSNLNNYTDKQKKYLRKLDISRITKISCVNEDDMEALLKISNNKITYWEDYIINHSDNDNYNNYDNDDDNDKLFYCNKCDCKYKNKKRFIDHIKKHDYVKPSSKSKLYDAAEYIHSKFKNYTKVWKDADSINFFQFIATHIDIQHCVCSDLEYVSVVMDQENNRGKHLIPVDIVKNPIITKLENQVQKDEVYRRWENFLNTNNTVYKKNYGLKIFNIAIQIYNGKIQQNKKALELILYNKIIESPNVYEEICNFFNIVEKLLELMKKIQEDRFGRLINTNSTIYIAWEGYCYLMLPIFYAIDGIDTNLIEIITRWYFRNLKSNNWGFSNLNYGHKFIKIANQTITNPEYNYYNDIVSDLKEQQEENVKKENYEEHLFQQQWTNNTYSQFLLMFLETSMVNDIVNIPICYTLEHIISQDKKKELKEQNNMHKIGNFTLLEGKNSKNGQKGNYACGSKPYKEKYESYKNSSSNISRDLAKYYPKDFIEENIIERSRTISSLLNRYTQY